VLGIRKKLRAAKWCFAGTTLATLFLIGSQQMASQGLHALPPGPVTVPPTIVFGFVGGVVRHDDMAHNEVQLAAKLSKEYPFGVHVEAFENRRREEAHKIILKLLDSDHDGKLSDEEKQHARVILYGHSWGASAVVALARELQNDGIPVLLTAQVDSISKMGNNDGLIPANVERAVNFYQPDGILHGRPEIHAVDPSRTKILGNYRFSYKEVPYTCKGYPWYDRVFTKTHTLIECDPNVWSQVENLIRGQLDPVVAQQNSNSTK
jgi:hypothetical protein